MATKKTKDEPVDLTAQKLLEKFVGKPLPEIALKDLRAALEHASDEIRALCEFGNVLNAEVIRRNPPKKPIVVSRGSTFKKAKK